MGYHSYVGVLNFGLSSTLIELMSLPGATLSGRSLLALPVQLFDRVNKSNPKSFYLDGCVHVVDSCIVICLLRDVLLGMLTSKMVNILYYV